MSRKNLTPEFRYSKNLKYKAKIPRKAAYERNRQLSRRIKMLTGKALFNTLLQELDDMGLPGMSAALDEMYRSPQFIELDSLATIAALVEPEYRKKVNKRIALAGG